MYNNKKMENTINRLVERVIKDIREAAEAKGCGRVAMYNGYVVDRFVANEEHCMVIAGIDGMYFYNERWGGYACCCGQVLFYAIKLDVKTPAAEALKHYVQVMGEIQAYLGD